MIFICISVLQAQGDPNITMEIETVTQPWACRTERRAYLLFDEFKADTCARCYHYMPLFSFKRKFKYLSWLSILRDPSTNFTYEATPLNTSNELIASFNDESYVFKWKQCCLAAMECCNRMLSAPPIETEYAYKVCWPNGTWFENEYMREWTNYSKCGRVDEHRNYLYFHIATYSISIVSLVPALIIFSVYKQLQVHRISMHKNLFMSLFLNGFVVILFKSIVILDELKRSATYETIMDRNGDGCKILFILTKYFRMTNYMWMFCEGFYLHKLIAAAFAEQKSLLMFYIIGWVMPIIPV
ncbi:Calcitonin gene-related peptide type 1 receptor like protein [Argiope bruennichi]|uniref:Calcitonin gene-related peptide type 1 receptor like protein n=1 Tax=Argiope bruennichi TaxID=94029 RepID=A0A8T0FXQ1_ARGBR|nr:Calcitonin gene-related peptide type 1 receptor like protein [Argiope bruennichi]